ncbi:MAG: hypothetical protein ACXU82_21380 [Caulobacteraceae bacterium]
MGGRGLAIAIAGLGLMASCGRPDASGVYVSTSARQATLIRLDQTKDGAVAGRVEVISLGPGGVLNDESATFDGAASNHDLAFKPTSTWFGGRGASGRFSGDTLTINRGGAEVTARKASLGDFQKAVSQLKARAAEERRQMVEAQARQAAQTAQATAIGDAGDKAGRLERATADLRADAARLDEGVSAAPDFGRRSVENTARIAQMARSAPSLARADRDRLIASANQVIVDTNQVDVARSRYAIGLDPIVQRASPLATEVQRFCDTPEAAPFGTPCARAKAAATGFESALVHASTVLKGYKQTIQTELARQNEMVRRMGG